MPTIKKNQKVLQAKVNGVWKYVFCNNIPNGLITTENRKIAIHGDNALDYFQQRYGNTEFRYGLY